MTYSTYSEIVNDLVRYLAGCLLLLCLCSSLRGQTTFTSQSGGGNWDDGATWDQGGSTPGSSDHVVIADGDVVTMANTGTRTITDMTLQGTGNLNWTAIRRLNVNGDLTMSGTSSMTGTSNSHRVEVGGNFDIPSGTATIGGIRITVDGTTTIDGTLSFNSVDGNKTFTDITVNTGGTWDNNSLEDFNIDGNIVANSGITWTGCSANVGCRYTIRTNSTGVSGAGTVEFSDMRINDNVTFTNTGNLEITDDIDGQTGTGATFVNDNGGTLTLRENGTLSEITFDFNNVGNTVIYSGSTNTDIDGQTYYDLEINMGSSTTQADVDGESVTVDNNMTITQGRVRLNSANTLAVTGNLTLTTNGELEPNNTSAVLNVTGDLIMTGGTYDHNNGDVNITDDFLITGGTSWSFTGSTSTLDADQISVAGVTANINGGTVTASNASATGVTIGASGRINVNNDATLNVTNDLSISGANAHFNPDDASTTVNISGDLLMSDGDYNQDDGDVNITGDFIITGGAANLSSASNATLDMDQMTVTGALATRVTLAGGTMTVSNASATGITLNTNGELFQNAATLNVTNDLSIAGANAEYSPNNASAIANISGDLLLSAGTYDHNNAADVNVTGDITVTGGTFDISNASSTLDAVNMAVTTEGATVTNGTLTLTGGLTTNSGSFTQTAGTVAVTGTYQVSGGTNDFNGGTLTVGALTVDGSQSINLGNVDLTAGGTSSISGTVTIDGATGDKDFNNVTTASSGNINITVGETVAIAGNLSMSGTSSLTGTDNTHIVTVTGTTSVISGTGTIGGIQFNANGATTIDGTLAFSSTTGNKTFSDVTLNASGTWNNGTVTEVFTFTGNLVNNGGTWTGCSDTVSCPYTMTSASGTFSGSGTFNITDLVINTGASYTNNGTIVMTDNITGTGVFINGATGVLELRDNGNYSISILTLNTVGNLVRYAGGTNETIDIGPFYDVEVNMDAVGTRAQVNGTDVTINNDLTINMGLVRIQSANTLAVGNNLTITTDSEMLMNNVGAILNVTGDIIMTGGDYDHNNGDTNITDDFLITGGELNITGTSTLDMDQLSIAGSSSVLNGGTITVTNASADGITLNALGVLTHNAATLNVTNDLNIAAGDAEYSPNNASTIANISGDLLLSAGTYDHNAGADVNVTGDITVTGGSFDISNSVSTLDAVNMAITTGTVTITNGTLTLTGGLTTNSGSITQSAGTVAITGTYQVSGGTNDYNGGILTTGAMTVDAGQSILFGDVDLTAGGTTTVDGTITFDDTANDKNFTNVTLTNSGNVNFTANETMTISGALNMSGTSSITGSNTNQVVSVPGTFDVPSGTGSIGGVTLSITGLTTVAGNLSITSATGTKSVGNVIVNGSGNIDFTANETLTIGGNLTMLGTSSITGTNANMVVLVSGTLDVTSGTASIGGVSFSVSGTTTLDGALAFTSTTGTKTFSNIDVNGSGNWNNSTVAEDFTISGNITNDGTWTGCSSNGCNYTLTSSSGSISGSGAMTATSDLVIDAPASYTNTNTGGLSVTDRITGTGTFINGANGILSYSGNNSGGSNFDITTFTASASGNSVTYARAGDMQLRATSDTENNYHNLIIATTAAGNDVSLAANITVDNQLTMTLGDIILDANRLTIADGATISGGDADSYIRINSTGVVRQNYSAAGATLTFPIGDNNDYSPITALTINSATFGASPYLEFTITDAVHPNRNTANTGSGGDDTGATVTDQISRYWTLTPNDITSPRFNATYVYQEADFTGTTEGNMVAAIYRTHPILAILDWLVAGTVNPTTNTVTITNVDAFGDLYCMDNAGSRLPITLLSFDVETTDEGVKIDWVTATEIDNELFTIERSVNGLDFEEVLYREGAGDSYEVQEYSLIDRNPVVGQKAYYRLKQTDFSGAFDYSEIKSVVYDRPESRVKIYPNPLTTNDELNIKINNRTEYVQIIDLQGNIIKSINQLEPSVGEVKLRWDAKWPSGMYIVRVGSSLGIENKKLIVR